MGTITRSVEIGKVVNPPRGRPFQVTNRVTFGSEPVTPEQAEVHLMLHAKVGGFIVIYKHPRGPKGGWGMGRLYNEFEPWMMKVDPSYTFYIGEERHSGLTKRIADAP